MSDLRDDARYGFAEVFGAEPHGLWSAPGRVNLIGEHTDYNDGFVLPLAIDRRTIAALGVRDDRMLRIASAHAGELVELDLAQLATAGDAPTPGLLQGWSAYPLGVAWALGQLGVDLGAVPGIDLYLDSSVPVGAGLSSSAALECAVALALADIWRFDTDRLTLARAGRLAENVAVGAPTGVMDQVASLFGERDAAVFLDCRSLDLETVPLGLADAGLELIVIETETRHDLADGAYAKRRASCERAAAALGVTALRDATLDDLAAARATLDDETFRRARHVITENQRVLDAVALVRAGRPDELGELLDASHRSMRDDFEISTPELDLAVETANATGALGARMTGGGFGGAAIALVPADRASLLRVAIDGAFAEHGYGQPDTFMVMASAGAKRDA